MLQALTHLRDTGLFTAHDAGFLTMITERLETGAMITDKQRDVATRLLGKYADDLRLAGIPWDGAGGAEAIRTAVRAPDAPHAEVARVGGEYRIAVRTPFALKDTCKSVPGARWAPTLPPRGAWCYPATPASARNIAQAFGPYGLITDADVDQLLGRAAELDKAQEHKTATDLPPVPGEAMESWLHQRQTYWWAREQDAALLALDMGLGKSKIAIDLIRTAEPTEPVLVLCPKKVLGTWPKQAALHAPGVFHVENGLRTKKSGETYALSVSDRTVAYERLVGCLCGKIHMVIANYEMTAHAPFKDWGLKKNWGYVVLDEGHRVRAPQGVWSKWVAKVRDRTPKRLILTGTPMGQSPLDLFGQARFLDPGLFGLSFTAFVNRYGIKGGYQGHEIIGLKITKTLPNGRPNPYYDRALAEEFDAKVFSVAHRVDESVLALTPVVDVTQTVDLPPAAMRVYKSMNDDLFVDLQAWNAGSLSAANVLVKMLRLQQLTGGALTDENGQTVEVHRAKAEALEDILEDIDPHEVVVVFARFVHDLNVIKQVAAKMNRPYAEVSGRAADGLTKDSTLALDQGIVGVQIAAGGVGVDLTRARIAIYYSLGYSLIDYQQSRKRLHRPGQERPVLFIHLTASRTIDEAVYEALSSKEATIEQIMERHLQERVL